MEVLKKVVKPVDGDCSLWETEYLSTRWDFWPPNSPNLNPLDYYVWGVIERQSNKSKHSSVNIFRGAIEAEFRVINRDQLKTACSRYKARIEQVIDAKAGYLE